MEHNLTRVGALARTLFGNNSLFPFENTSSPPGQEEQQEEQQEDLEVNTDLYSRVAVTVIYAALFAVGVLGNSVTLSTLRAKQRVRSLQGTVHYHLASLAASDLLILLLSMPLELHSFVWFHHPWVFGDAVCRGYYFLRDGCSYATALNVASLSAERYMAVCHPFKAKRLMSRSRTKKLIGAAWLASFALAAPMLLVMGQVTRHGENICTATVSPGAVKAVLQVGVLGCVRAHASPRTGALQVVHQVCWDQSQRPETRDQRPGPETRDQRPETRDQDQRPETRDHRLETRDQRPETRDQRPETRDQRPETRDQRLETRDQRPETRTRDHRLETRDQRPETRDQDQRPGPETTD
ncbi:Neurotensin receptor type 1 [Liparis tanakae]|uniref:Neurotensin receptor type 1 n=1 Tax=Liparis tanakae TaxID=230148 RepID=A0A4Z2EAG3_9TELE|nr:Neurotensin receptor type 1 [Liparis tanakae]